MNEKKTTRAIDVINLVSSVLGLVGALIKGWIKKD